MINPTHMAKFLDTTGVSYHLEQIIKNAKDHLILITPFLKINRRIKEMLEDKNRFKIDTRLIYGKSELQPEETNWLNSMDYIRTSYCDNLHAKCYLNENQALVTSMNLYEFSQQNNNEMGILVKRTEEAELYTDIYEEAKRLIRTSDEIKISVKKIDKTIKTPTQQKTTGYCIHCKTNLKLDPTHPLCKKCYSTWKKTNNPDQTQKYCHICGKTTKTTLIKPSCYECFTKNRKKLTFPKTPPKK